MKKFTAIIVDDEDVSIDLLKNELEELTFIEVVATANKLSEAEIEILHHKPDILFLDIEMHGELVFDLISKLEKRNLSFGIIFVSAYPSKYGMETIERYGLDYDFSFIEKPILSSKFIATINKLRKILLAKTNELESNCLNLIFKDEQVRILFDEIFYCETSDNQCLIHTADEKKHVANMNLKALEAKLPSKLFYRMSGQYIIPDACFRGIKKTIKSQREVRIVTRDLDKKLLLPEKKAKALLRRMLP